VTATTPPKGRPTVGKIDREAAARAAHRRNQRAKILWILVAIVIVVAVIYFGSGSGGSGGGLPGQHSN
jgi:hypothetical protein